MLSQEQPYLKKKREVPKRKTLIKHITTFTCTANDMTDIIWGTARPQPLSSSDSGVPK